MIPRTLTAGDGGVYVYDYGDSRLKAFDREGALRWRFGRSGDGPGEFANPMDIEVGVGGDVWVLDDGSNRLTTVSPEGDLGGTSLLVIK